MGKNGIDAGQLTKRFDNIKHVDNNVEWRSARDFQQTLEYTEWRNFLWVIQKAKNACKNSGWVISDHFVDVNKQIIEGKWAVQNILDIMLCLLSYRSKWKPTEIKYSICTSIFCYTNKKTRAIRVVYARVWKVIE